MTVTVFPSPRILRLNSLAVGSNLKLFIVVLSRRLFPQMKLFIVWLKVLLLKFRVES